MLVNTFLPRQNKPWTLEENKKLFDAYKKYPKDWKAISDIFFSAEKNLVVRSAHSCRFQFKKLDLETYKAKAYENKKWTSEEKQKLLAAHEKYSCHWERISKEFFSAQTNPVVRSASACQSVYTRLILAKASSKGEASVSTLDSLKRKRRTGITDTVQDPRNRKRVRVNSQVALPESQPITDALLVEEESTNGSVLHESTQNNSAINLSHEDSFAYDSIDPALENWLQGLMPGAYIAPASQSPCTQLEPEPTIASSASRDMPVNWSEAHETTQNNPILNLPVFNSAFAFDIDPALEKWLQEQIL